MKFLNQIKGFISKNPAKITDGLEKVTSQIDKRTGGKYADQLEKVTNTVEGQLDKLTTQDIDLTDSATEAREAAEAAADEAKAEAEAAAEEAADKLGK